MPNVIYNPDDLTPNILTDILHINGIISHGSVTKIESTPIRDTRFSSVTSLSITYAQNTSPSAPTRLILKCEKRDFLNIEIAFYTTHVPQISDTYFVRYYDTATNEKEGKGHLILKDVSESHIDLRDKMNPDADWSDPHLSEQVMKCYAQVHAHFWDDTTTFNQLNLKVQEQSIRKTINANHESLSKFFDFFEENIDKDQSQAFKKISANLSDLIVRRITPKKNITAIHADTNEGNVLIPKDPKNDTIFIIDWAYLRIWYGAHDLASHITRFWRPETRHKIEHDMLNVYHRHLLENGVHNYPWEDFWYDYRLGVIQTYYDLTRPFLFKHTKRFYWMLDNAWNAYLDLDCKELL